MELKIERDPNSGCWLWSGSTDGRYGQISVNGVLKKAHRVSYELAKGFFKEGVVCHTCDTPVCVNPDHFWIGSQAENLQDSARKGRNGMQRYPERSRIVEFAYDCSGEAHHNATISDLDVAKLRADAVAGMSSGFLAARYGVSRSTALRIATGKSRRLTHRASGVE